MVNRSLARSFILAATALFAAAGSVANAADDLRAMAVGTTTSQPIGHYEFCQTYKDECNIRSKSSAAPRVTAYGWTLVRDVNKKANNAIVAMTDQDVYGREEVWDYPTTSGDCEDFVLLKRKMLMEKGFSPADLLITVVRKPDGEGHAVLTLRTDDGDFILDNLEDDVKRWNDTRYTYLKRQASFNTGRWVTIENGRDVVVGALR